MDLAQLTKFIEGNQLVTGGLFVTATGMLFTYVRDIPRIIWKNAEHLVRAEFFVSVQIDEQDILFNWVRHWLHRHFKVRRNFLAFANGAGIDPADKDGRQAMLMVPAPGSHIGFYNGTIMWVTHVRSEGKPGDNAMNSMATMLKGDNYRITFLTRDASIVKRFLNDCRDVARPIDDKLEVCVAKRDFWRVFDRLKPRPLDSVILPDDSLEKLVDDLKLFRSRRGWYVSRGIPYRRGYLLHGLPGGGKSSILMAVAAELKMNLKILQLSSPDLNDENFAELLSYVDDNSILCFEDVDCAFVQRKGKSDGKLTFSGVLNALDGALAKEGRILFMTTNHVERLDEALIRHGRIDYRLEIKNATKQQAIRMYERFYPDSPVIPPAILEIEDYKHSMAEVQEMLMALSKDTTADAAISDSFSPAPVVITPEHIKN